MAFQGIGECDDSDRRMLVRCGSMGEQGITHRYPRVLVPRLPIFGRRQWNGWRLLSH